MKNVLVFGGSNSNQSINKKFASFVAEQLTDIAINLVDLNDYASPLYSVDLEKEQGVDINAQAFHKLITQSDAIIASFAEYNGLHTAAFKNLWDWMSRIPMEKPMNIFDGKPMFLLSTSPSKRVTSHVMKISEELFPHFGANIVATFYLPSFNHFFKDDAIIEQAYKKAFETQRNIFQKHINTI